MTTRSARQSGTGSTRTTLGALIRIPGGARYTFSAAVESVTSGMLRPFVVIYAVAIGLDAPQAGVALSVGRAAALAAGRSIRNAGLGVGALLATTLVAGGSGVISSLSLGTAVGCAIGAAVLATVPLHHADTRTAASAGPEPTPVSIDTARGGLRPVTVLALAGIPFAFYADVLEIALPVTLVQTLHASPAWSSGIFVGNTVLVVALQVIVVVHLSRRSNRAVLAISGLVLAVSYLGFWLGAALGEVAGIVVVAAVAVPYTMGEILYTGSSVPLVIESVPPHLLGRALARWQLSYGLARAADPVIITGLLSLGAATLWMPLAAVTLLGAAAVAMSGRAGHIKGYTGTGTGRVPSRPSCPGRT